MLHNRRFPLAYVLAAISFLPAIISGCSCDDDPPAPSDKPRITAFAATPAMVAPGGKTTISWKVENATEISVVATPGGILVDKVSTAEGSKESATINELTSFTLTARGEGGEATRTIMVAVTQTGMVMIVNFDATPATIAPGDSATLSYEVTNATRVRIDEVNGGNLLDSTTMFMGTVTVTPTVTTSYVLTAEGNGGPLTLTRTVMVEGTPVIVDFSAMPQMIELGDMSTLSWNVTGAATIIIRDSGGTEVFNGTDATGSRMVSPTMNETYTLTAMSATGQSVTEMEMVTVNRAARIISFIANPSTVDFGDSSSLEWEVIRASSIEIQAGGVTATTSTDLTGSFTVTATQTTQYTLIARNVDGDSTAMVTLTVNPTIARIGAFEANPNPAAIGGTSELSWSTIGALNIRITEPDGTVVFDGPDASGRVTVEVETASITYTLTAGNPFGNNVARVTLIGQNIPTITAFNVEPITFTQTSTEVTVTYTTADATSVQLFVDGLPVNGFPTAQLSGAFTFTATDTIVVRLEAINAVGSDSEEARVIQLITKVEGGNTAATATPLAGDGGGAAGNIGPTGGAGGDLDYYSFTVPANGNVWIQTSNGRGGCDVDTFVSLIGPDGTTVLGTDDDDGPDACSEIDPRRDGFAANLAAGTYYAQVRGFAAADVGRYVILVRVSPAACANGILERGTGESCDDANTTAGDGCNATCQIEPAGDVTGPGVDGTFASSIDIVARERWYRIVMQAEGYISVQTYVPAPETCVAQAGESADTVVTLFDAMFTTLGTDNDDGVGPCAAIDPRFDSFAHVQAGTYWVRVTENGNNARISSFTAVIRTIGVGCGNRIIETGETCDDGNAANNDGCSNVCAYEGPTEMEPNNAFGTATVVTGTIVTVAGSISANGDLDFYRITVPAGNHLDISVTVNSLDACPSDPTAQLQLLGPNGSTVIATNSTGGAGGNCGRLWKYTTGITPTSAGTQGLAAGDYFIRVNELGDNNVIPAYFLTVRIHQPNICGNTVPDTGEACDDGNRTSGDTCSATCRLEPGSAVTLPAAGTATVTASVDPYHERDGITVTLTAPAYLIAATFSNAAANTCTADTVMRLFDTDGVTQLGEDDDDGTNNCSFLNPSTDPFLRLAAGTYYLSVEDYLQNNAIATFQVLVDTIPVDVCGNRVREPGIGEACDDGNVTGGDGCSATCGFEPEFTFNAAAGQTQTFSADITPATDTDLVQINVAAPVYLRAETFAPTSPDCNGGVDTVITLLGSTGTVLGSDDQDGVNSCSLINPMTDPFARLEPGTYFLQVEEFGRNNTIAAYQVTLTAQAADVCGNGFTEPANNEGCDDGNTASGDGCSATCQVEISATYTAPGAPFVFSDSIVPATNIDFVQVTVTTAAYLRVEVFSATYPDCLGGADPLLRIRNAATAVELGNDNNDGRNSCALFIPLADAFARVAPGVYNVSVEENGRNATIAAYELRIWSVPVDTCGNGFVEPLVGAEQCDDSNTVSGDGCSATCQLDAAIAEVEPNNASLTPNASGLVGAGIRTLTGAISVLGDSDYFSFEVPVGAQRMSLRARTYSTAGNSLSTCDDSIDTRLRLYNPAGVEIENNDDIAGASNRCSFIDGIGGTVGVTNTPDTDPNARNLLPGVYTMRVSFFSDTLTPGTTGTYFLQLQLVQE